MTFDRPSTKEEMYETLNEIYFYYNHNRIIFDNVEHEELIIPKMTFTPLTDIQLTEKATEMLKHKHTREKEEKKNELLDKIASLRTQKNNSVIAEEELVSNIAKRYKESIHALTKKSWGSGVSDSSITIDGIKDLEKQKAEEILKIRQSELSFRNDLDSQISIEETNLINLEQFLSTVHEWEIKSKVIELKDDQEKLSREIHKYNGSASEREIKYKNSMKNAVADMEIRYLGIHEGGFTEDELVEMGYYKDMLQCVTWYYETMDDYTAYHDIKNENKLLIYLRGYYSMILQVYKIKAGSSE